VKRIALSERELAVLNWMGRSKSNGDIATILGISPATVDTYARRIFAKLGTNDRIASVVKGVRLGLIRY
jgi:DNA-binding CsgD family transcriptional regulator